MVRSILRDYREYLATGTLAMLASVLVILLVTRPTGTAAFVFFSGISCVIAPRLWRGPGGRILASFLQYLSSPRLAYGFAALFLLAVPLTRYLPVDQWSRPSVIPINHLISEPDGGVETIRVPADTDQFLLILNLVLHRTYTEYTVKILDATEHTGREEWSGTVLEPTPAGNFNLKMSRGFPQAGQHRIELYGRSGETTELVAKYNVQIADG